MQREDCERRITTGVGEWHALGDGLHRWGASHGPLRDHRSRWFNGEDRRRRLVRAGACTDVDDGLRVAERGPDRSLDPTI
jgi:hypothetical protein